MVWRRSWYFAGLMAMLGLNLLVPASRIRADALTDLNNAFREAYSVGAARTLANLRTSVPVLVNRFGEIALYRPGVERPDFFSMDMKLYLEARAVAHTAAALYTRLAPFGLGTLDDERLDWLAKYQALLSAAEVEVNVRTDIPEQVRAFQVGMLVDMRRFAQRIHQQGAVDQAVLDEMGLTVRSAIQKNLEFAAASQLEQFRVQVGQWKAVYPTLAWDRAVAVTIGFHQARDRYLQRQFFDWMLRDQPNEEARVVFAETMTPPPSLQKEEAKGALMLLSKVMLDKGLSSSIFGDPLALQSDVLGDAAEAIIRDWP